MSHDDILHHFGADKHGKATCPAHDDKVASLSIALSHDGSKTLLKCHAGCAFDDIIAAAGLSAAEFFHDEKHGNGKPQMKQVATYDYRGADGALLFQSVRFETPDGKTFRQRTPDGKWSLAGVEPVLYRLPEIQGKETVVIPEGEKDVDALRAIGFPATCNPMGAGKWREEYTEQLAAAGVRRVVIIADNDPPGWKHACAVAAECWDAGMHVRLIRSMPGVPEKGDVSDYISAGHGKADLLTVFAAAEGRQRVDGTNLSAITYGKEKAGYAGPLDSAAAYAKAVELLDADHALGLDKDAAAALAEKLYAAHQKHTDKETAAAVDEFNAGIAAAVDEVVKEQAEAEKSAADPKDKAVKDKAADLLVSLAADAELFVDADDRETAYATIPVQHGEQEHESHLETCQVRSRRFKNWLTMRYYAETERGPSAPAMADAISTLEAKAHAGHAFHRVHVRTALHDGRIYIDRGDDRWTVIEVDDKSFGVVSKPPVRFRRSKGMKPLPELPEPTEDGIPPSIDVLRPFVNVRDADWPLVAMWVVQAACPNGLGSYPVLALAGEHGSAKTTTTRVLRSVIDPSSAPANQMPKDPRDLMIQAGNAWVLSLDNLSFVTPEFSDCLCRISTGGSLRVRSLYTDADETILSAQRPIVLNGIGDVVTRPDLLSRAIIVNTPHIADADRMEESAFNEKLDAARPHIFAAILNTLSVMLAERSKVVMKSKPRMADFAVNAVAAERAVDWEDGTFMKAYRKNQSNAHELAIETSLIGEHIRKLGDWSGTASELMNEMNQLVDDQVRRSREWPQNADAIGKRLRKIAPNLRSVGYEVMFDENARPRTIRIKKIELPSSSANEHDKEEEAPF